MGLDQYATARKGEAQKDEEGFTYYEDTMELACWRKHPNLTGMDGRTSGPCQRWMVESLIVLI